MRTKEHNAEKKNNIADSEMFFIPMSRNKRNKTYKMNGERSAILQCVLIIRNRIQSDMLELEVCGDIREIILSARETQALFFWILFVIYFLLSINSKSDRLLVNSFVFSSSLFLYYMLVLYNMYEHTDIRSGIRD